MKKTLTIKPEPKTERRLVGKREMSAAFNFCPRTADNFIAKGLPHIAISTRKTLFDLDEVQAWLHRTFSVSRIGKANVAKPAAVTEPKAVQGKKAVAK